MAMHGVDFVNGRTTAKRPACLLRYRYAPPALSEVARAFVARKVADCQAQRLGMLYGSLTALISRTGFGKC